MSLEQMFLTACEEEPGDLFNINAYHDWLLDNNRGADAEALANQGPIHKLSDLQGQILSSVVTDDENTELIFTTVKGVKCKLYHNQDCDESVWIEDINGDLNDLVGVPILLLEEISNNTDTPLPNSDVSYTWTYYRIATRKGFVSIRWYGTSNGYYSESVDFVLLEK